jgi:arsenite oxidase small subunit
MAMHKDDAPQQPACMTRRAFLFRSGAAAADTVVVLPNLPGLEGKALAAEMVRYPKMKIGKLSALQAGKPVVFSYPDKGQNSRSVLVKLGAPAGGPLHSHGW